MKQKHWGLGKHSKFLNKDSIDHSRGLEECNRMAVKNNLGPRRMENKKMGDLKSATLVC